MRKLGFNETPGWLRGKGIGKSRWDLEMAALKTERVANFKGRGITNGNGMNEWHGYDGGYGLAIRTKEEEKEENGTMSQVEGMSVDGNGYGGAGAVAAKEEDDKDEDEFMTGGVDVGVDVNVDAKGQEGNGEEGSVNEKEWEINYE